MMIKAWIFGLVRIRGQTVIGGALGIALAISLLAILGLFITHSAGTMTTRAIANLGPYWQVQLVGTTDATNTVSLVSGSVESASIEVVDYADVTGFTTNVGGTVQSTGEGQVVGLAPSYFKTFPNQGRLLSGTLNGPLLAQQTAANLHAAPGDKIKIARLGLPDVEVTVSGIVEMPNADQFFQLVNSTSQTAPHAPPDNVLLLPADIWESLFGQQLANLPQTSKRQIHVSFSTAGLPSDPVDAFVSATGQSNNLLAKLAGEGVVTNNLAARLDGVRQDSLFAKVLFLFLGLPGAIVALLLTAVLIQSGAARRRQEVSLMQLRGFTSRRIIGYGALEGVVVGILGAAIGLALASLISDFGFHFPASERRLFWFALASMLGVTMAVSISALPIFLLVQHTVSENQASLTSSSEIRPAWQRLWLDMVFLGAAGLILWQSSISGYQVVLAPEGVATATVDYKAYLAPGLLWIGVILLLMRLCSAYLKRGVASLTVAIRPIGGRLAGLAASGMAHERARVIRGIALVAAALSFATSTSIFNTTYQQQAAVDAALTNGADVAITGTIDHPASQVISKVQSVPGVSGLEAMQHRFAYVGNDLQDLYGIDPAHISAVTPMSDAYFESGNAAATLRQLQSRADGILVSDETVKDFQLNPGDKLNLRLRRSNESTMQVVPFTFLGVVREFPTAPRDSFLVANSSYIANQTGIPTAETLLVKSSIAPHELASRFAHILPPEIPLKISDVSETAHRIGSSLTAVDLHGLTTLELGFAIPLVGGALGLVFALGLAERKRNFAILLAIGAENRQLAGILWSEALVIFSTGLVAGVTLGWVLAWVLVKLTTQVFDPPPESLSVPWFYIAVLVATGLAAMGLAVLSQLRRKAEPLSFTIRAG